MRVAVADEERLRLAGRQLSERLREFREQYGIQDKQDLLAMVALATMADSLKVSKEKDGTDAALTERLARLDELLTGVVLASLLGGRQLRQHPKLSLARPGANRRSCPTRFNSGAEPAAPVPGFLRGYGLPHFKLSITHVISLFYTVDALRHARPRGGGPAAGRQSPAGPRRRGPSQGPAAARRGRNPGHPHPRRAYSAVERQVSDPQGRVRAGAEAEAPRV